MADGDELRGHGTHVPRVDRGFERGHPAGEVIGVEGDLPKALQALVDTGAKPVRARSAPVTTSDAASGD